MAILTEDFWERLERLIKEKSSRKEIARECGIAVNTIAMWIKRKSLPNAHTAVKLANALGVSADYLMTGEEPTYTEDDGYSIRTIDPDFDMASRVLFKRWIDSLTIEELYKLESELPSLGAIGAKFYVANSKEINFMKNKYPSLRFSND